ncbi:hypothetical protein [Fluviispira vulneris]|uniref:hypothetical protein n=1 Tax=Fluviispira vulneris TaxID=2763012 RepID=UPI0016479234|nr:hypothetical protein [Fluviispira vulneris]
MKAKKYNPSAQKIVSYTQQQIDELKAYEDQLHKDMIYIIDNDITRAYADMKKHIRKNLDSKRIIHNRNIYTALINLKKSAQLLIKKYEENFDAN